MMDQSCGSLNLTGKWKYNNFLLLLISYYHEIHAVNNVVKTTVSIIISYVVFSFDITTLKSDTLMKFISLTTPSLKLVYLSGNGAKAWWTIIITSTILSELSLPMLDLDRMLVDMTVVVSLFLAHQQHKVSIHHRIMKFPDSCKNCFHSVSISRFLNKSVTWW